MALSYKGLLFRRIVVNCGFTYGSCHSVKKGTLALKYGSDYDDQVRMVYKRNKRGYWERTFETFIFNRQALDNALRWLEQEGYITIREERYRLSRNYSAADDYIRLTDKGRAAAPAYLKAKDPYSGEHGPSYFNGVDLANEF